MNALAPHSVKLPGEFDQKAFATYLMSTNAATPELLLAQSLILETLPPPSTALINTALTQLRNLDTSPLPLEQLRVLVTLLSALPDATPSHITLPNNTRIDWREHVAKHLISRQRIDPPTGHGFWISTAAPTDDILPTITAIRILAEL